MKKTKNGAAQTNKKKNGKKKEINNTDNLIINYLIPKNSETKEEDINPIMEEKPKQLNFSNISNIIKEKKTANNINNNNPLNAFIKSEVSDSYIKESNENYKNKIIIDDVFINNFICLTKNSFDKLESNLAFFNEQNGLNFYNKNNYEKFSGNLELLICKFFLHLDDYFLFVPNILSNLKIEDLMIIKDQKHKIKLFEGFQNTINICLQYHPITNREILNEDVADKLYRYLKKFTNKSKKNSKSAQKAFVLYDDNDYLTSQKIIEAVCNDLDFNILKIDDLENKKLSKFNKISEATQSQRITSISDIVKEKLGLLEKILNNNNNKFISFFNQEIIKPIETNSNNNSVKREKSKTNHNSGGTSSGNNSNLLPMNDITKFFIQDTKERKIFKLINQNILKLLNMKKTLILLSDSFTNIDEAKSYVSSVMGKINDTKCPIVILTNNLNFAKADNIFNNSQKTISNKFIFSHVDNKSIKIKQKIIYIILNILFLHLILKDMILNIIFEIDLNDNNILQIFNEKIKEKYMKSDILITEKIFEELIKISIKICSLKKYDFESILFFIKQAEKKFIKLTNENFSDIVAKNIEIIGNQLKLESKTLEVNTHKQDNDYNINKSVENLIIDNNYKSEKLKELQKLIHETDIASIMDMEQGIIQKQSDKSYQKFFYNEYVKYKISQKAQDHKKIDDENFINCESVIFSNDFNYEKNLILNNLKTKTDNDNALIYNVKRKDFHSNLNLDIKRLKIDDKIFYKNTLNNKLNEFSQVNIFELNYFLKRINDLKTEEFIQFFGLRKPRSTRKHLKDAKEEYETKYYFDEFRFNNGFQKIFNNKINQFLLERYFKAHDVTEIFFILENRLYKENLYLNYYSGLKDYEDIKNISTNILESTSEFSYSEDESSI